MMVNYIHSLLSELATGLRKLLQFGSTTKYVLDKAVVIDRIFSIKADFTGFANKNKRANNADCVTSLRKSSISVETLKLDPRFSY